jgi:hypothetical protein
LTNFGKNLGKSLKFEEFEEFEEFEKFEEFEV